MSTALDPGWIEPEHGDRQRRDKERRTKARTPSDSASSGFSPTDRMGEWDSVLSLVRGSEHIDRIEVTFSRPIDAEESSIVVEDRSDFADQIRDEYQGEGLVAIDTVDEYVIAVASSWEDLDDQLAEADYNPENTLTLRCYE